MFLHGAIIWFSTDRCVSQYLIQISSFWESSKNSFYKKLCFNEDLAQTQNLVLLKVLISWSLASAVMSWNLHLNPYGAGIFGVYEIRKYVLIYRSLQCVKGREKGKREEQGYIRNLKELKTYLTLPEFLQPYWFSEVVARGVLWNTLFLIRTSKILMRLYVFIFRDFIITTDSLTHRPIGT